jgi:branched-chain amino acid transport system ATP-binding protein
MLAIARALVGAPRAIMLDEPSAGLSPKLVGVVFERLREIAASGVAVVLVEQNVKAALAVASRAVVLVEGRERLVAPAAELRDGRELADLYLGRLRPEAA